MNQKKQTQRSMKEYTKPEVWAVVLPDSLMGDVNIGIASKPDPTEGELPAEAKENVLNNENGSSNNPNNSLWDE